MNDGIVQSALREMRTFGASPRLWLTFGAVVLLFAITGPYGTAERLAFVPRLAYWLVLHAGAWFFALTFVIFANVILRGHIAGMFWRMMIGSILAAAPIGLVVQLIELSWFGTPVSFSQYVTEAALAMPLCMIFCVITFLAMSAQGDFPKTGNFIAGSPSEAMPASPPAAASSAKVPSQDDIPLLIRLNPENRGSLQHISVADHYSMVHTSRGRELILLRFSDAIRETGTATGLQVHRSHWVAKDFVHTMKRSDGRLLLLLKDGSEVPVSRTYTNAVREYFS